MKKLTKTTKALRRTLIQQDLAAVLGGTGGVIIVENGTGGSDKTGTTGTG